MSGIVGITIRDLEGKVHRTCGLTDQLDRTVNDMRIVNQEMPDPVKEYLSGWERIKKKYLEALSHGQDPTLESYGHAKYAVLAPVDYGLLVIDMQQKRVYNHQNYTGIGYRSGVNINEGVEDILTFCGFEDEDLDNSEYRIEAYNATGEDAVEFEAVRFKQFLDAGRIKRVYHPTNGEIDIRGMSLKEIDAIVKDRKKSFVKFELDLAPYSVTHYTARFKGEAIRMREGLLEAGFTLDSSERKMWDEWIASCDGISE